MREAYERELKLLPVVIDMEQRGVPLSEGIHDMLATWEDAYDDGEQYIESLLPDDIKIGSRLMFSYFCQQGLIDESKVQKTEKGNPRFGREFLHTMVTDEKLKQVLLMRSKLEKIIGTYLRPWAKAAPRFYPFFNQTRGDDGYGTRTGRFSSNMQQIPKEPEDGMPNLRSMIVAEPGHVLLQRDFASQEIRVAAHFAGGGILKAYKDNPALDAHEFVQEMVKKTTGVELTRKQVKIINFMKLYGGGPKAAMGGMGVDYDTALEFYKAYDEAFPEFRGLAVSCENDMRTYKHIDTWGGRKYEVEEIITKGMAHGFEVESKKKLYYKLINVKVQGSSADMTKEAMIRYHYSPDRHPDARIMLQVHDELVVTCPAEHQEEQMEVLRWAMDDIPGWDVPLRSDGGIGENFGELEEV